MAIDLDNILVSNIYSFNNPLYLKHPEQAYGENYKTYLENGNKISEKLFLDTFKFLNKNKKPDILYFAIGAACNESKYNILIQEFPSFIENMIKIPNFTIGIVLVDTNCKLEIIKYINNKYKSEIDKIDYEYNTSEFSKYDLDYIQNVYLQYTISFKNKCSIKIALIPDWLYKDRQFELLDYNINLRNIEKLSTLIVNFGVHYNNKEKSLLFSTFAYERFDFRKILKFESIKNPNVKILEWGINYINSGKYSIKYLNKNKRYNIISNNHLLSQYLVLKKNINLVSPVLTENEILIPLDKCDNLINSIINHICVNEIKLDLNGKDLEEYITELLPIQNLNWNSTKIEII